MNKKRIIIMSFLDLWSMAEGQGAPSFYNTVKAYVDNGWETILIQPSSKYRKDYKVEGCKSIKFENTLLDRINSVPKLRFFARGILLNRVTKGFYKEASRFLEKGSDNTIIYSYEIHAVKAGKKIKKEYNIPLVTRFQGTILTTKKDNVLNRIIKYPHFGALREQSDLIIMTDDGTKGNEVLERLNNKTKKILFYKNGQNEVKTSIEINKAKKKLQKELNIFSRETVLLTVSRLKNWKRVDRAIQATKKLLDQKELVKLVIVGDGEERENLQNLTRKLQIEDKVVFVGSVKQENIWEYYSLGDIFLSLYDLSNVGNPLMEALKYGKAIITINNGDTGELITNNKNGILIDQSKVKDISKHIKTLLKNKDLKENLEQNASLYAKQNLWSWKERMKAEVAEVEKLLK